jgi:hypothetical protein
VKEIKWDKEGLGAIIIFLILLVSPLLHSPLFIKNERNRLKNVSGRGEKVKAQILCY